MPRNDDEKEKYVCQNHEPDSCIFTFRPTKRKPTPICPICGDDEFLSGYSGDKKPNKSTVLENEAKRKAENGKTHPATKTKRRKNAST